MITRREFVSGLTLAGTSGLLGVRPETAGAEPPPEMTTLRLGQSPSACQAPLYVAEDLLRGEGFTDVKWVKHVGLAVYKALAAGETDMTMIFVAPFLLQVDADEPILLLAGGHVGCLELFGTEQVRSLRDLKGKTVAVAAMRGASHLFLASMLAYVGLDPRKDVHWVTHPGPEAVRLLAEGKIDAFMSIPPQAQELRANRIGRVVVDTSVDRPWSQYFCCMIAGNREFVRKHPSATKRAVRAVLKGADVCALEPKRAARVLVDKGFTGRPEYLLQMMQALPYNVWREYEPEDTVRFYALRLQEVGMIKSSPQKIIAQGTDWRFLNELKKELKG